MRKRRVRGPTVWGPGEPLFPFLLRNMRGPDIFQWQPCAIRRNSPLPRDGIPETERIRARHKLDYVPNDGFRKQHNHRYRRQELKKRKTHYASYRSDEQLDQGHMTSPTRFASILASPQYVRFTAI